MKRRKLISITVCVCLLICMFPQMAFAAETEPPANQGTEPVSAADAAEPSPAPSDAPGPSQAPANTKAPSESSQLQSDLPAASESGKTQNAAQDKNGPEQTDSADSPSKAPDDPESPGAESDESSAASSPSESSEIAAQAEDNASAPLTVKKAAAANTPAKEQADTNSNTAADAKTIATVSKTAAGITVSGGIEGKDWTYDPGEQTLTIHKDGMTVSGTATDDLAILCALAVTTITIDHLDHGSNVIALMSADENGNDLTDLTIKIQGTNRIDAIIGIGDVSLVGTKNSRLDLTLGAMAFQDLNFKNAVVNGGSFAAVRDLNITGKSIITAKANKYLAPGDTVAMISAGRDLNINLAKDGKVTAYGYPGSSKYHYSDRTFPFLAGRSIHISKGSHVATPGGGKVGTYDYEGLPLQVILNADGSPAVDASVQYGANKSLTASAAVSDVSTSPQTGDYDSGLIFLFILLLAGGTIALITRKKVQ